MASSGSISSLQTCEEENVAIDQRKRKRMISNRESAKRSRAKKQKQLDDLTALMTHLRAVNDQIVSNMSVVTQLHMNVEFENSVLRAQMAELSYRLQALNDIMINSMDLIGDDYDHMISGNNYCDDLLVNPWGLMHGSQPIMASPDVFMYY